jgi:hypothetical protein
LFTHYYVIQIKRKKVRLDRQVPDNVSDRGRRWQRFDSESVLNRERGILVAIVASVLAR